MGGLGRLLAEVDAYLAFWDLARGDDGHELMLEAYPHRVGAVKRIGWYTAADR